MAAIQKGRALQSRRRSGGQSKCWLAFGETDNGGPRLRKQYAPNYYAAFVLDPDGNIKGSTEAHTLRGPAPAQFGFAKALMRWCGVSVSRRVSTSCSGKRQVMGVAVDR